MYRFLRTGLERLEDRTPLAGDFVEVAAVPNHHLPPTVVCHRADANGDGLVTDYDFEILSDNYGRLSNDGPTLGDFNNDGVVSFHDFLLLSSQYSVDAATHDSAIQGNGYFLLQDKLGNEFFTRESLFALDNEGFIVSSQGLYVQRFSGVGEPTTTEFGFQVPGDTRIQLPIGVPIQGRATKSILLTGNLDADSEPSREQTLTSANPFTSGDGAIAAVGSTLLNDLDAVVTPYRTGDRILIEGQSHTGARVTASLVVEPTSTVQDLVHAIDAAFPNSTANLLATGRLQLKSNSPGVSNLSLQLRNAPANIGAIAFPRHRFETSHGKGPDAKAAVGSFYDEAGRQHEMSLVFKKRTGNSWSLEATLDPGIGTVVESEIDPIAFNDSGNLSNDGSAAITVQIFGIDRPQSIDLSFSKEGQALRLTQYPMNTSLIADSDGSAPGVLARAKFDPNGEVVGVTSSGAYLPIAQLAIALFPNEQELKAEPRNIYRATMESGTPQVGAAGSNGRGLLVCGECI